jgi:AcrR family transcriptional regulator
VLDKATQVFARRGYASATIQDIADELGILKGSIYYYIDSKEDLLFELFEEIHAELDELLARVRAADVANPLERLALYVRTVLTYNLGNLVKISVYHGDLEQLGLERRALIEKRRAAHDTFVIELIKRAQRDGLIAPGRDPRLLANQVFAVTIWPYRWYKPRGRLTAEDVVETAVEFTAAALARRP